jgi:hypothetical protein
VVQGCVGGDGVVGARPCSASPLSKEEGVEATLCASPRGCSVTGWEDERTLLCSVWGVRELPILVRFTGFSSQWTGMEGKGSVAVGIGTAS